MPTLPSSGTHWIEPAASGAASVAVPVYLVKDGGGDWVYAPAVPAQGDWIDWEGTGEAELLDLTAARIVTSGADLLITTSTASAVAAIVADAGGGDLEIVADLTRAVAADLFIDGVGTLVIVRRTATRRAAMQVAAGIVIY